MKLKRGIYETEYGNAAYVSGPSAKSAFDLDARERIPLALLTGRRLVKSTENGLPMPTEQYHGKVSGQ